MRNKTAKTVILVVAAGILLTASTLFWPKWVESAAAMTDFDYGAPFAFLNQSTTVVFSPDAFPRYMIIQPWSNMFDYEINPLRLILSLAVNILIVGAVVFIARQIRFIYLQKHPEKRKKTKKGTKYTPVFK